MKNANKIHIVDAGFFKLDGGAMFGVVPRTLWQQKVIPDSNGLCTWTMRCLLVQEGDRKILIDCGMGNKQSEKFFAYYEPFGNSLLHSLSALGVHPDEITDVLLTHLHFDHCGGAVYYNEQHALVPTFRNATYWTNERHWRWACEPNAREKASFLKENFMPLLEQGQLKMIDTPDNSFLSFENPISFSDSIAISFAVGHTDYLMIPQIRYNDRNWMYVSDLLPSVYHVPMPWVMAYDTRPLLTLQDKEAFLPYAATSQSLLILEHDAVHEACLVKQTEKGIALDKSVKIADFA